MVRRKKIQKSDIFFCRRNEVRRQKESVRVSENEINSLFNFWFWLGLFILVLIVLLSSINVSLFL